MWPHKPMFWNFRNMISGTTPLEMLTITETAFCDTRHAGKRHIIPTLANGDSLWAAFGEFGIPNPAKF